MAQNLAKSFTPETDQQEGRRMRCLELALAHAPRLSNYGHLGSSTDISHVEATALRFLAFVEGKTGEAA